MLKNFSLAAIEGYINFEKVMRGVRSDQADSTRKLKYSTTSWRTAPMPSRHQQLVSYSHCIRMIPRMNRHITSRMQLFFRIKGCSGAGDVLLQVT